MVTLKDKKEGEPRQSWLGWLSRILLVGGAMVGSAVGIAVIYAISDLYLTGHGYVQPIQGSTPWHYQFFSVLLFIIPAIIGVWVYRASGK